MPESYAFEVGARVRIQTREAPGHVRTPAYTMGKTGIVAKRKGYYRKPEDLAYGKGDGEPAALYSIRFRQADLWPDYEGRPQDTLLADVFEYWLDPAE